MLEGSLSKRVLQWALELVETVCRAKKALLFTYCWLSISVSGASTVCEVLAVGYGRTWLGLGFGSEEPGGQGWLNHLPIV